MEFDFSTFIRADGDAMLRPITLCEGSGEFGVQEFSMHTYSPPQVDIL